jgi:hypothetical protein
MIVRDFSIPPSPTVRSYTPKKKKKERKNQQINIRLNDTIEQMVLNNIYRVAHQRTAHFTLFSAAHGTFSKVDHILGHNVSLNMYKKLK